MKRQYKVRIKLKTNDIWDIDSRVKEVRTIRKWINELCDWNPDEFEIKLHSMGAVMDVWFEDQERAILCKLSWS